MSTLRLVRVQDCSLVVQQLYDVPCVNSLETMVLRGRGFFRGISDVPRNSLINHRRKVFFVQSVQLVLNFPLCNTAQPCANQGFVN